MKKEFSFSLQVSSKKALLFLYGECFRKPRPFFQWNVVERNSSVKEGRTDKMRLLNIGKLGRWKFWNKDILLPAFKRLQIFQFPWQKRYLFDCITFLSIFFKIVLFYFQKCLYKMTSKGLKSKSSSRQKTKGSKRKRRPETDEGESKDTSINTMRTNHPIMFLQ